RGVSPGRARFYPSELRRRRTISHPSAHRTARVAAVLGGLFLASACSGEAGSGDATPVLGPAAVPNAAGSTAGTTSPAGSDLGGPITVPPDASPGASSGMPAPGATTPGTMPGTAEPAVPGAAAADPNAVIEEPAATLVPTSR